MPGLPGKWRNTTGIDPSGQRHAGVPFQDLINAESRRVYEAAGFRLPQRFGENNPNHVFILLQRLNLGMAKDWLVATGGQVRRIFVGDEVTRLTSNSGCKFSVGDSSRRLPRFQFEPRPPSSRLSPQGEGEFSADSWHNQRLHLPKPVFGKPRNPCSCALTQKRYNHHQ